MFLHSGASLHGHEFSNKPPNRPVNQHLNILPGQRRNTLLRSAFTTPNSTSSSASSSSALSSPASASSISHASTLSSPDSTTLNSTATSSPTSIIRSSSLSDGTRASRPIRPKQQLRHVSEGLLENRRPPEPVVRFLDPVVVVPSTITRSLSTNTTRSPTPSRLRPQPPRAPESMSEDDASFSASEASYASDQAASSAASSKPNRRRRTSRKSTTYLFAHPAPKLSTKKQLLKRLRPTLLLQLQQLSPDRRPLPVIDVYPSSLIAGNVAAPRFSKRFPRLFGINGELGLHDTILVQSEDYDSCMLGPESENDDDVFEHRALLAVLSPLRRGDQSEIALEDGSVWTTTALPTGSFDFVRIDEHGFKTTARWVRRAITKPAAMSPSGLDDSNMASAKECKFTFSIIDPQSRRHPILATLTRSTLEILDRYTTVSSSASRYPPTRPWAQSTVSHDADASNDEELSHDEDAVKSPAIAPAMLSNAKARTTLPVDDALKTFISISAIWVSMQCGWGQTQTASQCSATGNGNTSGLSKSGTGSLRFTRDQLAADAANASDDTSNRGRRLSARYKTRSATLTSIDASSRDVSPSMSPRILTSAPALPRKASSTGAAYIQRRKQMQASDTSDSEKPSALIAPRRRSRAFSRLSGEFTAMVSSKFQQSPTPSEAPTTPIVSFADIGPIPSFQPLTAVPQRAAAATPTISAVSANPSLQKRMSWTTPSAPRSPSLPRGGRSLSAIYATNPLADQPGFFDAAPQFQNQQAATYTTANEQTVRSIASPGINSSWQSGPDPVMDRASNTAGPKWKRLSNWFKRLGGGGNNISTATVVDL